MKETHDHTADKPFLHVNGGHGLQPVEIWHTFVASENKVIAEGATEDEAIDNLKASISAKTVDLRRKFFAKLENYPEVTAEGATEDEAIDNLRARVSLSVIETGQIK